MSRGPWTQKTRAKRGETTAGKAFHHEIATEPWRDRRVKARARARDKTKSLVASVLWRVASENRKDAQARGAVRYVGSPCDRHTTAERYTATGHCVICAREYAEAARGGPVAGTQLDRKLRKNVTNSRHVIGSSKWGKPHHVAQAQGEAELIDADVDAADPLEGSFQDPV